MMIWAAMDLMEPRVIRTTRWGTLVSRRGWRIAWLQRQQDLAEAPSPPQVR